MTVRRSSIIDTRSADFQRRYDPAFAWKSAASVLRGIPGLRGAWTMGNFDGNADQFDISGQGRTLSYNGNPTYNYDGLIPYLDLDGTGDYLSRADEFGLDILGTETYVAVPGLTLGLWFSPDLLTAQEFLFAKDTTAAATSSYRLEFRGDIANDPVRFVVCDGAAFDVVALNSVVTSASNWYFVVGRYDPSTEIKVYAGGQGILQNNTNAVGIPAALNNSNAQLTIGASSAGAGQHLDGQVSLAWLSCMYLSDTIIASIFQQQRALFGQ